MKPECQKYEELIIRHDALDERETSVLTEHLAACGRCRAQMSHVENLGEQLLREATARMPADLTARIMGRVVSEQAPVTAAERSWGRETGILASMVAILGSIVALLSPFTWHSVSTVAGTAMESLRAGLSMVSELGIGVTVIREMGSSLEGQLDILTANQSIVGGVVLAVLIAGILLWENSEEERDYRCAAQHSQ